MAEQVENPVSETGGEARGEPDGPACDEANAQSAGEGSDLVGGDAARDVTGDLGENGEQASTVSPFVLLWYTLARIGLLLGVGIVLYLVGARSWLLLLLALIISGLLSYLLLQPLRDAVSRRMSDRVDASRARRAAAQAEEDDIY